MAMIEVSEPYAYGGHLYVKAPKPVHFRSEEPLEESVSETKRHLEARTTLYLLMKDAITQAVIGSEQFVYSDPGDPRKCLSPDVFVKLGSTDAVFDNWKVWERGAPDVAVEIVSDHDRADKEWSEKLARYKASGVGELVRFDADDEARPIRVWDRVGGDLVERSAKDPKLQECAALGLYWAIAPSEYGPMLRLARDPEGRVLLATPAEERVRLSQELTEERRARSVAEHERMLAEHALQLAENERTVEKEARIAAEQRAREEAEARSMAERERDEAMAELAKLRAKTGRPRSPRR